MKRLLLVALPAGLAMLGAILLLQAWRARGDAFEARLERSRLKREFAERSALARALPTAPPEAWQAESAALVRWYVEGLSAIRNRHPGEPARPTALAAAEEEKKLAAKDRETLLDFQRYAEERFELLRGARYAPVASAVAEGLRLDLLAIQPGPSPEGGPGLRVDFALWGAPRLLEREATGERSVARTVVPVALRQLSLRLLDEQGALFGGMAGGGEPHQKLLDGERFVEDFPPAILFGTYWLELLPRQPVTLELELTASVRGASGRERPAALIVTLPIEEGWRLPPGAEFKAEVREGPQPVAR
ncbi:MAG: hypothetical protein IPO09_07230 [Anaeromyxobacter sp.]|nr:hypothetical protein [Anaeromyxobacter sp.]MBL0277955.1 hypothetical protein [Anaeromyxobacter sp.]